uniref:Ycf34 n=1 Tax=Bostrychia moritziana TaxID=103713 RepID=A0A1Z1M713_BOSMO|nr:hypothetical protein [Bostrychia moritziana]ARW61631.1 hypothetical protein [Bostrychia moritziana]
MCICINCRHIYNCKIYHFIEEQHCNIFKKKTDSLFIPQKTIININLHRQINNITIDWDLVECLSFIEKPGHWLN